jgi:hypothetical protein
MGETLPYLTDILWLNEPVPGASALPQTEPEAALIPSSGSLADQLQAALNRGAVNAADQAALEEKLRLTRQATGRQNRLAVKPGAKSPSRPLLPLLQGEANLTVLDQIIDGSEGAIHTWEADIRNVWQGTRNGVIYQVLAGASADDPTQGLVIVIEAQPKLELRREQFYLTGEPTGALRIQQAQEARLLLTTADGGTLYFDLAARTFEKP